MNASQQALAGAFLQMDLKSLSIVIPSVAALAGDRNRRTGHVALFMNSQAGSRDERFRAFGAFECTFASVGDAFVIPQGVEILKGFAAIVARKREDSGVHAFVVLQLLH